MTTIAAFAAIAIAASFVVGLVAPRLVSLGVPDAGRRGGDLRRVPRGGARRARPAARGRRLMIAATDIVTLAPGVDDPAGAAARRGAWPRLAVERERGIRARARRPPARSGGERAGRRVLAPGSRGARRRAAIRLAAQPPRARERRAHGVEARPARRLAATRGAARTGRRVAGADHAPARDRHPHGRARDLELPSRRCCRAWLVVAAVATILAVHVALIVGAGLVRAAARRARHGTRSRAPRGGACGAPAGRPERARRARAEDARPSRGRRSVAARARRRRRAAGRRGARAGARCSEGCSRRSPAVTIAGCPFAAHALALTVVGGDGRVACGL